MRLNPTRILEDLRATYWFIPSCMVTLAVGLSFLMPWFDQRYGVDVSGRFGWIGQTQTDGARAVLSAVAGSIIGVAGTTFSITMVAVSFASANFGPRLIANFMRDRGNQITLGTFIATFVYCLLVLRRVHGAAANSESASYEAFVPHLSVIVALLLALASVGVLIYFIHHVPETINIDRLVSLIGRQLQRSITDPFPGHDADDPEPSLPWRERIASRERLAVTARETGFVERIDLERLVELADEHDALVRVQYRPGDFIVEGDTVFEVWTSGTPAARDERAKSRDEPLPDSLLGCLQTSYQRTAEQDCLFLADQLVEVIGRAMSPGINDPFTAITCLDWLKNALIRYLEHDTRGLSPHPPGPVFVRPVDFERLVAIVFDQTRQYTSADRDVALHAMAVLAEIGARTKVPAHLDSLRRRMDELRAASVALLPADVGGNDVARRHAESIRLLGDPDARGTRLDDAGWFGGSG